MADYYVREEDGSSHYLLEDSSGALLVELQTTVAVPFISSATQVFEPTLPEVTVPFIASTTTVYALSLTHGPTTEGYSETFTVSDTWVCPPGLTSVYVECIGGGGAGGRQTANAGSQGGGGGGAYAARVAVPVTPGSTYTVTVGTAGVDSSFTGDAGVSVVAAHGNSPTNLNEDNAGLGGTVAASTGDAGHVFKGGDGGAGGGNSVEGAAGGGASGNRLAAGAAGTNYLAGSGTGQAGGVGANGGGSGGKGGDALGGGSPGVVPGGGGGGRGGGGSTAARAAGAAGEVILSWGPLPPFIPSVTVVYGPTLVSPLPLDFISSVTAVYAPTLADTTLNVPFIGSSTVVYTPTLQLNEIHVPFISSVTRVFGVFSTFDPDLVSTGGLGNGGESFLIRLAPNGGGVTATLVGGITSTATELELSGDSGMPTSDPFVVTIGSEVLYVVALGSGIYRIRSRGQSNTTPSSHSNGANVTWDDSYDMPLVAASDIAHELTADVDGSGTQTYQGWLICFDSSQAYLGASRYPMHVTSMLGVFADGAGSGGTNHCDAAQPNAVCTPVGASNDCPAALSNPSRIQSDISAGDVALVRYTNPAGSALDLGPRSTMLQSWFGMKRVDDTDNDVTLTDPTGHIVDTDPGVGDYTGSVNDEFDNPSSIGIGPDTGLPTPNPVPFTTVTLPGGDRYFTYGSPHYSEKGWPIGVLTVRHGTRRIPLWRSWDWHDFSYVYNGFGTDATFAQLVINRNGIIYTHSGDPMVDLPGPQDIDGPNAVWDDGTYHFGVSWYVAIYAGSFVLVGPSIGGGSDGGGSPTATTVPVPITNGGSGGGGTVISTPPGPVEGGSGGDIGPGAARAGVFLVPSSTTYGNMPPVG